MNPVVHSVRVDGDNICVALGQVRDFIYMNEGRHALMRGK